ncbi:MULTISPECIES: sugar phosphate isomerase/epimerase family protein [unclassified Sinorhizobium]|uniref:sugar phosphate isomerase/epimerase family protein n=1 Tax=unclassified Sinorhizobium TaxID=2613772 RepID=UPI0035232960
MTGSRPAPFKPALCTVTFRGLRPAAIVPLALEARLAAIEWAGDVHVPPGDEVAAQNVGRLTRDARMAISYGSYVAPPSDDLAVFSKALATAKLLGASNIRIWPGTRGRDSGDYSDAERRVAVSLIREMGEAASEFGITVSLEYHPNSLTDETSSALSLIEAVAHENVYLYWQPRPGLPLDEALTEIARVGPHVSHIHVFAWDGNRNRFPLSNAADYWRSILAAMPDSRWKGPRFAMLEFVTGDDPDAFLADAATLRRLLRG